MALPTTMQAIKVSEPGQMYMDPSAPVPTIKDPKTFLVRVSHIALNPTDWKGAGRFNQPFPGTLGCDASGTVVAVGEEVTSVKIGDRVGGGCYGLKPGEPEVGAFGEYAVFQDGLVARLPENVSLAEGATLGVGVVTIAQCLYQSLKLPLPVMDGSKSALNAGDRSSILIYGGSTATGLFAIQFAHLSGYRVFTTLSPRNFDKVRTLGADVVFDYREPDVGKKIREATGDDLCYVLDCITEGDSLKICADAITSKAGVAHYVGLLKYADDFPRDDVKHEWRLGYTSWGAPVPYGDKTFPASKEDGNWAKTLFRVVEKLLEQGKLNLKALEQEREGGLEGALEGLKELQAGKVTGGKFVYRV